VRLCRALGEHQGQVRPERERARTTGPRADARHVPRELRVSPGKKSPPERGAFDFKSTTGGVMTEEVAAVTGDFEVSVRSLSEESIEVATGYAGADKWTTVEGSHRTDTR